MSGRDEIPKVKRHCLGCGVIVDTTISCRESENCIDCCACGVKTPAWVCECGSVDYTMLETGSRLHFGSIGEDGDGSVDDDGWETEDYGNWECDNCGRRASREAAEILGDELY